MNDLHRYKDAIVCPEQRRLVKSALALCPSKEKAKSLYFQKDYICTHGLGALVLQPGETDPAEELAAQLKRILPSILASG
jgi:hypothetical protein